MAEGDEVEGEEMKYRDWDDLEEREALEESAYERGQQAAYRRIISECSRELPEDERNLAHMAEERAQARRLLKELARELGIPDDWPDNLHLADVIEKRIMRQLPERE